jgi:DNA polymerase-3 subunit gamma/tau
MFDNILYQDITRQLAADVSGGALAPALLFFGPRACGKGTAALELARILSCEGQQPRGAWNCACSSCARHRALVSRDLLMLGQKPFFAEIAACAEAYRREPQTEGTRRLFVRAARKLLARFSPVLWEDDPKLGKLASLIGSVEEALEEFERAAERGDDAEKFRASLLKNAAKLEEEGMGELIPIAQIRRAAYWSRLAPAGLRKCVIIENADRMKDEAKNSLLKILEEPPERLTIMLTCVRPGTLLPTMLSRLRQYRFARRGAEEEADVIRRVFRDPRGADAVNGRAASGGGMLEAYLESFLPVDNAALYPLGAYFTASVAAAAAREIRGRGRSFPEALADLGKFAAPFSEEGDQGKPEPELRTAAARIFKSAENFEIPGLFQGFCKTVLELISAWLRAGDDGGLLPEKTRIAGIWKTALDNAVTASELYNIQKALVFDRLGEHLKNALTGL